MKNCMIISLISIFFSLLSVGASASETSSSAFDPKSISWASKQGRGSIDGTAFYRKGKATGNCAYGNVTLTPRSPYADDRFAKLYGNMESASVYGNSLPAITNPVSQYKKSQRISACTEAGAFTFSALPPGEYYLTAWVFDKLDDGRTVSSTAMVAMKRVALKDGQALTLQLFALE